jgi:hypothetical protein
MISLEVSTEPLSQALRSASSAQEVVVKLAKKNDQPVFSFEAQTEVSGIISLKSITTRCFMLGLQSRQGKKMLVTHDVRITVMKAVDMEQVKEPLCPPPDVRELSQAVSRPFVLISIILAPYNPPSAQRPPNHRRTHAAPLRRRRL